MQRGKRNRKNMSVAKNSPEEAVWKKAIKALVIAWVVTLMGLVAGATILYFEWIDPAWISGVTQLVMLISMFVGGFYMFRNTKGRDRVWILAVLIAYLAFRFLLSLILTF